MTNAWAFAGKSPSLDAEELVTLVDETSFCLSSRTGDVRAGTPQGLFYLDTRLLSRLELQVNGAPLEPLSVAALTPFAATFAARARSDADGLDSPLLVLRRRYVGRGLREDVEVRNYGREPITVDVQLRYGVDFAELFAVKEGRVHTTAPPVHKVHDHAVEFQHGEGAAHRRVRISAEHAEIVDDRCASWQVRVPAHGSWSSCVQITVRVGDGDVEPRHRCGGQVDDTMPTLRLAEWQRSVPILDTDWVAMSEAFDRSLADVGSLRLFDPGRVGRPVVAAGAPWYMTIFGRDSLLTAYESLLAGTDLAVGVLQVLAELQGSRVDANTEEQPGRILHEIRYGSSSSIDLAAGHVYYGTADATPLFVMLLGECLHWGVPYTELEPLLPHADRALDWMENYGDRDGDGFVEYERLNHVGLANQGWKDSWDGIPFADGRLPDPPIALCEVQGYAYAAYLARAELAAFAGDDATRKRCRERAAELKRRFNDAFWLPDLGYYAIALDGQKRPVDGLASNMGHCLWTGVIDEQHAAQVAARLLSPDLFSGWGIRTLASSMASYNPGSYHCGSVWPHDNALCAQGLMRYGFVDEARRVIGGMLAAAAAHRGRLPELFSGLDRSDVGTPVSYPTSCSPQAWSAAAPLLMLRTLLRLDPDVAAGRVWLDPVVPPTVRELTVDRIPLAESRLCITVSNGHLDVQGAPPVVGIVRSTRSLTY